MPRLRQVLTGPLIAGFVSFLASAQSEVTLIKGATVHAKPRVAATTCDVLIEKGIIRSVAPSLEAPEGAKVVDANGKHLYPSLIDALNSGLFESSSARPGSLSLSERALDVYDGFAGSARRELLESGIGIIGLGFGAGRPSTAPLLSVALSADKASVLDEAAVAVAAAPAGAAPFQGGSAVRSSGARRKATAKAIEDALDSGKKYREAQEKYEKDLEEWKKKVEEWKQKKGSPESKPATPSTGDAPPRRGPAMPEGFRDWPREKQQEWIRENLRGGQGNRRAPSGDAPTSAPAASGEKRPDPPEKPKRDPYREYLVKVNKGEAPLWVEAHWATEIEAALDVARARNIRLVVVGATEAMRVIDRLRDEKAMVALSDPTAVDPDDVDTLLHREDLSASLEAAGVPVVISSLGLRHNGIASLPLLAALHMGRGLSEDAALAAVTSNAARALGMSRRLGTIESGRDAQLILTTGPLFDPTTKVVSVVAGTETVTLEAGR